MKKLNTLILFLLVTLCASAQQFDWAETYNVSNTNEVGAVAADASGNIYITGVHDAPVNLPYQGPVYILKTDPDGEPIWSDEMNGLIQFGDMATVGDNFLIIGQATGAFSYRGESYGQGQFFMFVIMMDENGDVLWHFSDQSKWGNYTNIAVGNTGDIALHIRGGGNLGDWIYIVDVEGNILQQKQISAQFTMVMDIAYWDGKVYFNGGFNGPGSVMVDTILVELPDFENASITMGFDENLTAQWLYTGQTINNQTGKIMAHEHGLYVYEPLVDQFFNTINSLKIFGFDGELIKETEIPVYSSLTTVRPALTVSQSMIGLMFRNAPGSNLHAAFLYDLELNLLAEKEINGPSGFYSGQISHYQDDFFVSHIHTGNVNFDNEITLSYSGTESRPYIAKIKTTPTDIAKRQMSGFPFLVYPNPATDFVGIEISDNTFTAAKFVIRDAAGKAIIEKQVDGLTTLIDVSQLPDGLYFIEARSNSGNIQQKFLKH